MSAGEKQAFLAATAGMDEAARKAMVQVESR